jgi:hypothetical protein
VPGRVMCSSHAKGRADVLTRGYTRSVHGAPKQYLCKATLVAARGGADAARPFRQPRELEPAPAGGTQSEASVAGALCEALRHPAGGRGDPDAELLGLEVEDTCRPHESGPGSSFDAALRTLSGRMTRGRRRAAPAGGIGQRRAAHAPALASVDGVGPAVARRGGRGLLAPPDGRFSVLRSRPGLVCRGRLRCSWDGRSSSSPRGGR